LDYDLVEESNLQRQIIHSEETLGKPKSESAKEAIKKLNSICNVITHNVRIDSTNAMQIIKDYDIVLDCTDNPATRYLLNDTCVLLNRPLVSGSALRLEGQLTVYNWKGGPCYRCIFPKPPPAHTVTACGEGGVLGAGKY